MNIYIYNMNVYIYIMNIYIYIIIYLVYIIDPLTLDDAMYLEFLASCPVSPKRRATYPRSCRINAACPL